MALTSQNPCVNDLVWKIVSISNLALVKTENCVSKLMFPGNPAKFQKGNREACAFWQFNLTVSLNLAKSSV